MIPTELEIREYPDRLATAWIKSAPTFAIVPARFDLALDTAARR